MSKGNHNNADSHEWQGRDLYRSKEQRAYRAIQEQLQATPLVRVKYPVRKRRMTAPEMEGIGIRDPKQLTLLPETTTTPTSSSKLERSSNASVADWIATRRQQHVGVESMGISSDWLDAKQRCPAETKYRNHLIAKKFAQDLKPSGASASSLSSRSSSVCYVHHESRSLSTSPTNVSPTSPMGSLSMGEATQHFRNFVQTNRWRLHDLFSRCGLTNNYLMTPEQICGLLEPVGGLTRITFSVRHSMAYARALESEGKLNPISSIQLQQIVESSGVDRDGLVDYRTILDDYDGQHRMKRLQRLDKSRRRRYSAGWALDSQGGALPSVHSCIAQSIKNHRDPLRWLEMVGDEETTRQQRIDRLIEKSRPQQTPADTDEVANRGDTIDGERWQYLHGSTIEERQPVFWSSKLNLDGTRPPRPPNKKEAPLVKTDLRKLRRATGFQFEDAERHHNIKTTTTNTNTNTPLSLDTTVRADADCHNNNNSNDSNHTHTDSNHRTTLSPSLSPTQSASPTAKMLMQKQQLRDQQVDQFTTLSQQLSERGVSFSPEKLMRAMVSPTETPHKR